MIRIIRSKSLAFKLRLLSVILVALVIALTITAVAASAAGEYVVDIYENGTVVRTQTTDDTAEDILESLDIEVGENDRLDLSLFKPGEASTIVIYRACKVTLTTPDGKKTVTFAGTVEDLLDSEGITVGEDELVNYPIHTVLTPGMEVTVEKACLVTVVADGEETTVRVGFVTVSDALEEAKVEVGEDDKVSPSLKKVVKDGTVIKVQRVTTEERTETEKIAYTTVTKKSDSYNQGYKNVTQKGEDGEKKVTYIDKYVDGELVESEVKDEEVIKEAVDEIVTVGTKTVAIPTVGKSNGKMISELAIPADLEFVDGVPKNYKSIVTGKAVSYSAKPGALTASGRKAMPGHVAIDPKQFPYGTEMWIVATDGTVYGYAIAADTGEFVHNGSGVTVDLFMNTYEECVQWGAKQVVIYVLS